MRRLSFPLFLLLGLLWAPAMQAQSGGERAPLCVANVWNNDATNGRLMTKLDDAEALGASAVRHAVTGASLLGRGIPRTRAVADALRARGLTAVMQLPTPWRPPFQTVTAEEVYAGGAAWGPFLREYRDVYPYPVQIGNEPNLSLVRVYNRMTREGASEAEARQAARERAERYAMFVVEFARGVKSTCPECEVTTGGLGDLDGPKRHAAVEYLQILAPHVASGVLAPSLDIHVYRARRHFEREGGRLRWRENFRAEVDALLDDAGWPATTELLSTEANVPSDGGWDSEAARAEGVETLLRALRSTPRMGPVCVFSPWHGMGGERNSDRWLIRPDTPAGDAVRRVAMDYRISRPRSPETSPTRLSKTTMSSRPDATPSAAGPDGPAPRAPSPDIHTLQIGMGWFAEQAGGLNRVFDNLMRALPQEGVSVQGLVAGTPEVAAQTDGRVVAFTDIAAPLPTRWRAARRAALQLMDAQPPDLIASHFTFYTAPLGRHLRDRPLVMHFHGPWAAESAMAGEGWLATQLKRRIEQRVYRSAGLFIVLSEAFRDVLHRTYGIPHERIRIVPGGADVDRFDVDETRVEARLHLGWPTDRPLIFAVRRLQRRMGIEALLAAMKRVRAQVPDVLLMIAGSGPLAPELEARIDELGLHQHVRLLGYLPEGDLPRAYRAADFSVVPTVALEGFGLITVESLAAGTPVLVTPVGGLPEVVRGLSERLVLAGSDTDALAEGLEGALSGALPLPDASACRAYAVEHFSWGTVARRVRAVYEEALR